MKTGNIRVGDFFTIYQDVTYPVILRITSIDKTDDERNVLEVSGVAVDGSWNDNNTFKPSNIELFSTFGVWWIRKFVVSTESEIAVWKKECSKKLKEISDARKLLKKTIDRGVNSSRVLKDDDQKVSESRKIVMKYLTVLSEV